MSECNSLNMAGQLGEVQDVSGKRALKPSSFQSVRKESSSRYSKYQNMGVGV